LCGGGGTSGGGTTGGGATSGGATGAGTTSGSLPGDTCASCTQANCTGQTDDCVCDPHDSACANGYCAPDCYNSASGGGQQSICTGGTQCIEVLDGEGHGDDGHGDDWVCYPASGTCI
jgi:hypothetical protein